MTHPNPIEKILAVFTCRSHIQAANRLTSIKGIAKAILVSMLGELFPSSLTRWGGRGVS
jgi:hypothetical protein